MIKINFFENGFDVCGHALFDNKGNDIVCASVSGIILGSLNWFDENDISKCEINKNDATISFGIKNLSKSNLVALDLIKTQLLSIEKNYKLYLQINYINKLNN
ncbi:MAG: ribosomal-processing cysteine protease Prp [Malacoplasma sp.]